MAQAQVKTRKQRTIVSKDETKAEKFVRLGKARISKAVKQINAVKQLSGPNYECTDEQALKVVALVSTAVDGLREAFKNRGQKKTVQLEIDL